jgi:aryl carrier-like protein
MQLLGISTIDTKANLFDLGARSLTVVRAVTELRRYGFHKLTTAQVYEHSSIAGLSAFLTAMPATSASVESAPERGQRQRAALSRFKPRERNRS